jgi:hypothetical protein
MSCLKVAVAVLEDKGAADGRSAGMTKGSQGLDSLTRDFDKKSSQVHL